MSLTSHHAVRVSDVSARDPLRLLRAPVHAEKLADTMRTNCERSASVLRSAAGFLEEKS